MDKIEEARMSVTGYFNSIIQHFGLDLLSAEYILLGMLADIRQQKVQKVMADIKDKEVKENGVQQGDV